MYISFGFIAFGIISAFVSGIFLGSVSVDMPDHAPDHAACDARYRRMCQKYRVEIISLEKEIKQLLGGRT